MSGFYGLYLAADVYSVYVTEIRSVPYNWVPWCEPSSGLSRRLQQLIPTLLFYRSRLAVCLVALM